VLLITRRGAILSRTKAVNQLKSLVVAAREELRHQLRNLGTDILVHCWSRLRTLPSHFDEHRATVIRCATPPAGPSPSTPKPTTSKPSSSGSSSGRVPCLLALKTPNATRPPGIPTPLASSARIQKGM
jgi:hypothetical protein